MDTAVLVNALAQALLAKGQLLVVAESCTGGLLSAACTDLAGSSLWFERGFITYSNAAKTELLGVPEDLLQTHGAVSTTVAAAMARGALARSQAQHSISITGIAGPGGASDTKPVGMVCFGFAGRDLEVSTQTQFFSGDRATVRASAVNFALTTMLARL